MTCTWKSSFCEWLVIYDFLLTHRVLICIPQEIQCLQDHYDNLEAECQDVIGNFTEDEDEMPELDIILMKACTPMINKFCDTVRNPY